VQAQPGTAASSRQALLHLVRDLHESGAADAVVPAGIVVRVAHPGIVPRRRRIKQVLDRERRRYAVVDVVTPPMR